MSRLLAVTLLVCSVGCVKSSLGALPGDAGPARSRLDSSIRPGPIDAGPGSVAPDTGPVPPPERFLPDGGIPLPFLAEPVVAAPTAPVPVSGGTLLVSRDGARVYASDPDRDVVSIVQTSTWTRLASVALRTHDEPGRLVEDATGRIHVALRRGGRVASFAADGSNLVRTSVCPSPRGLLVREGALLVACESGELVRLDAATGAERQRVRLSPGLRDVLVDAGGALLVTRFGAAETLTLEPTTLRVLSSIPISGEAPAPAIRGVVSPKVMWRSHTSGTTRLTLHQLHMASTIPTGEGAYGGSGNCSSVVLPALTVQQAGQEARTSPLAILGTPVDAALSPDGQFVAVASVGVHLLSSAIEVFAVSDLGSLRCATGAGVLPGARQTAHDAVGVAFLPDGRWVAQLREPAAIAAEGDVWVSLAADSLQDTGFDIFHAVTSAGLSCASCHPEGGDDAAVWTFQGDGPRRTQSLRGGVEGTAPFHWAGDQPDFTNIMAGSFQRRMSGGALRADQVDAVARWVETIPRFAPSPSQDPLAVARGSARFASSGCASCHSGVRFTDNRTVDIATGGAFQVPSLLGVSGRAPFLHDGTARTLEDLFTNGHAGPGLSATDAADLARYLETL